MKRYAKRNRILTLALVFCLSAVLALSTIYVVTHASHHCVGDDCPICQDINHCLTAVHFLWESADPATYSAAVSLTALFCLILMGSFLLRIPSTLVALKIRLNN